MTSSSPLAEGFRSMFREPLAGVAEVVWRWSAAGFALCLLLFLGAQFVKSLPLDSIDLLLLRSGNSWLIARALAHILGGSAPRLLTGGVVVLLGSTVVWIVLASAGRAATVQLLLRQSGNPAGQRRPRFGPLVVLNTFRAAAVFASKLGMIGILMVAARIAGPEAETVNAALSLTAGFAMLIVFAWYIVNWFLSLATFLAARDGCGTLAALEAAADLCRRHPGAVAGVTTAFWFTHFGVWIAASGFALLPLSLLSTVPAGVVMVLLVLLALVYFAVVDFLYVGRLAAYLAIPGLAEEAVPRQLEYHPPPLPSAPAILPDFSPQP